MTTFVAALLTGPMAASQPVEPLGRPRPVAPPAPPDVAEAPPEATKTASGLAWKLLRKGKGTASPGAHDKISISFTGWTLGGDVIASSIPDGEAWSFEMREVVPGLSEGLRLMVNGEKRRLWIPAALTTPGHPKHRTPGPSVFDVELVSFVKVPDPIPVPEDVDAAPADAKRTASGLAYKVLKRGKGKQRPDGEQHRRGPLQRLDPRRKAVRQLRPAGHPNLLPSGRRHQGLDRRRPADGRRREDPLLDSGSVGVR